MSWKIAPIGRGGDLLYSQAGTPSLDLRFAEKKALTDYVSGDNLVTFSRSSSAGDATYVDSDGFIKRAKVNLLPYSEAYTQWIANNGTVTQGVISTPSNSNSSIRKNGGTDARASFIVTIANATTYTVSGYVRAVSGSASVSAGVVQEGAGTPVSISDTAWTRITHTFTSTQTAARAYFASNSDFYLWGAQLETGSTATDYIPTTGSPGGAPRFDHDPTTGESLGLLVEEARTNVILYSEDFTNAYWATQNGSTALNTNNVLNPKGAQAYLYTAASGNARKRLITANTTPGAVPFAFSIYVKDAGARYIQMLWGATGNDYCNFDLGSGTPGSKGSGISNPGITPIGNGWYRLSMYVQNTTASQIFAVSAVDSNNATFAAFANYEGEAFYLFGAQVEAGSFPTSYIPTSGAQATRAADVASITGSNFSSWYTPVPQTWLVKYKTPYVLPNIYSPTLLNHGSLNYQNDIAVRIETNTVSLLWDNRVPETFIATSPFSQSLLQGVYAIGIDLPQGSVSQVFNGEVKASTFTAKSFANTTGMYIGTAVSSSFKPIGHISRLTYWPQRLPNTTLQTITT